MTTNYTRTVEGTGSCDTAYSPTETTVCATTLTGLATKVTVTDCDQEVTFSTEAGFTLETPTPVTTNHSLITPAPTVKSMYTYWLARWQSLTAGESPSDVDVKICTVMDDGELDCIRYQEIWEVVLVTQTVTTARTVQLSTTVSGPGTLLVETYQSIVTDTVESIDLSTVLHLATEFETESTSSGRKPVTTISSTTEVISTVFITKYLHHRSTSTPEPTTTVWVTSVATEHGSTEFLKPDSPSKRSTNLYNLKLGLRSSEGYISIYMPNSTALVFCKTVPQNTSENSDDLKQDGSGTYYELGLGVGTSTAKFSVREDYAVEYCRKVRYGEGIGLTTSKATPGSMTAKPSRTFGTLRSSKHAPSQAETTTPMDDESRTTRSSRPHTTKAPTPDDSWETSRRFKHISTRASSNTVDASSSDLSANDAAFTTSLTEESSDIPSWPTETQIDITTADDGKAAITQAQPLATETEAVFTEPIDSISTQSNPEQEISSPTVAVEIRPGRPKTTSAPGDSLTSDTPIEISPGLPTATSDSDSVYVEGAKIIPTSFVAHKNGGDVPHLTVSSINSWYDYINSFLRTAEPTQSDNAAAQTTGPVDADPSSNAAIRKVRRMDLWGRERSVGGSAGSIRTVRLEAEEEPGGGQEDDEDGEQEGSEDQDQDNNGAKSPPDETEQLEPTITVDEDTVRESSDVESPLATDDSTPMDDEPPRTKGISTPSDDETAIPTADEPPKNETLTDNDNDLPSMQLLSTVPPPPLLRSPQEATDMTDLTQPTMTDTPRTQHSPHSLAPTPTATPPIHMPLPLPLLSVSTTASANTGSSPPSPQVIDDSSEQTHEAPSSLSSASNNASSGGAEAQDSSAAWGKISDARIVWTVMLGWVVFGLEVCVGMWQFVRNVRGEAHVGRRVVGVFVHHAR
ncbi:hypothetical protein N0V83_003126 [Neocucurbitaria cava]|uniref:Uncharacterized protein n=1 Tax=Neocucurbitaria cava TaxID=798079 RepID=A0A9W9CPG1_9PLEO|nr:hypothetical protein N0V83_003126 [Neocucurbitaria cava]